ncbi:MAG: carboxypeptidase-like regulatory domain-containing protein [Filimonas sp.]|nr:carboxypeptidase-like regulatory domain-containing protein [Filimonas sp.]
MAEQNNHINFSLADIERYLQGRMLPKEMHDLEKAALQDPFLADAIEGYSHASSEVSNKHLNEIAAALQHREEDIKVVPITLKSKVQWWKIAAMFIVIAGAGTASWLLLRQDNTNTHLVQTEKKNIAPQSASTPAAIAKADSTTPVLAQANSAVSKRVTRISKNIPLPKAEAPVISQAADSARLFAASLQKQEAADMRSMAVAPAMAVPQVQANSLQDSFAVQNMDNKATFYGYNNVPLAKGPSNNLSNRISASGTLAKQKANSAAMPSMAISQQTKSFQLKGRVVNDDTQPVASAVVKLSDGKAATITDDQGFFTLYAPDSISRVNISSVGYASIESDLRKGVPNTITLKENSLALSEVVVTELRSRKELTGKLAGAAETKGKEPYPEKGWPSFQEYVYTKLNKKHEYDSTYTGTVTGRSVELEFMVDANGNPYNFKILHSVDEVSDKKAIEIVKEGPRWITTNRKVKKAKVTIKL